MGQSISLGFIITRRLVYLSTQLWELHGDVIVIIHQYAYVSQGITIHSCIQIKIFEIRVDDKLSKIAGGTQSVKIIKGTNLH